MLDEATSYRLAEIEHYIRVFKEKFDAGTSDPDDFLPISEIEKMWGELQASTKNTYSEMLMEMMSGVDESGLIAKKNASTG